MNIGKQILEIRKKEGMTQEQFGDIFHVTRQTVSNWENEKSYPELQILVAISVRFDISLDTLIKENPKMVKEMDKDRALGALKRKKSQGGMFRGIGTGLVISCLFSPDSTRRLIVIGVGIVCLCIGWYLEAKYDKRVFELLEDA